MSWSPEVSDNAESILAKYPEPRSAVMPLLYLAMREDRGLTPEGMREVAARTALTPVQVESVASFYSMFKQGDVAEYVVSVCTSISCHLLGGDDVLEAISDEAGTKVGDIHDGVFFVERAECIGACGGAPAVQVNYELVEGVTPEAGRRLCRWLAEERPGLITSDHLQGEFGGVKSFDWGPEEPGGAIGPVPAFEPYGTAGEST